MLRNRLVNFGLSEGHLSLNIKIERFRHMAHQCFFLRWRTSLNRVLPSLSLHMDMRRFGSIRLSWIVVNRVQCAVQRRSRHEKGMWMPKQIGAINRSILSEVTLPLDKFCDSVLDIIYTVLDSLCFSLLNAWYGGVSNALKQPRPQHARLVGDALSLRGHAHGESLSISVVPLSIVPLPPMRKRCTLYILRSICQN